MDNVDEALWDTFLQGDFPDDPEEEEKDGDFIPEVDDAAIDQISAGVHPLHNATDKDSGGGANVENLQSSRSIRSDEDNMGPNTYRMSPVTSSVVGGGDGEISHLFTPHVQQRELKSLIREAKRPALRPVDIPVGMKEHVEYLLRCLYQVTAQAIVITKAIGGSYVEEGLELSREVIRGLGKQRHESRVRWAHHALDPFGKGDLNINGRRTTRLAALELGEALGELRPDGIIEVRGMQEVKALEARLEQVLKGFPNFVHLTNLANVAAFVVERAFEVDGAVVDKTFLCKQDVHPFSSTIIPSEEAVLAHALVEYGHVNKWNEIQERYFPDRDPEGIMAHFYLNSRPFAPGNPLKYYMIAHAIAFPFTSIENTVLSATMSHLRKVHSKSEIDWFAVACISRLKRSPQELERRWAELLGVIPSCNWVTLSNRERGMLAGIVLNMGLDLRDADLSRLQNIKRGNNVEYSRKRTVGIKRPLPLASKPGHDEDIISYDSMTDSQGEEDEMVVKDDRSSFVHDKHVMKKMTTLQHNPPITNVMAASSPSSSHSAAVPADVLNILHGITEKGEDTFSAFSILQDIGIADINSAHINISLPSLLNSNSNNTTTTVIQNQQQAETTGNTQKSQKGTLRIFEAIEKLQRNKK